MQPINFNQLSITVSNAYQTAITSNGKVIARTYGREGKRRTYNEIGDEAELIAKHIVLCCQAYPQLISVLHHVRDLIETPSGKTMGEFAAALALIDTLLASSTDGRTDTRS